MCTDMKSVYTDFIDWLIFSGHQFVFSVLVSTDLIDQLIFSGHQFVFNVHQFSKISVNRYTGF